MESKTSNGYDIIRAAGGIVTREVDEKVSLAVVHRPKYDDWSLPKGKLKVGEAWIVGAVREVQEEIQCEVSIVEFVGCCCYPIDHIPKVVLYWSMTLTHENTFTPNAEIDQLLWLTEDKTQKILTYSCERNLIEQLLCSR